MLKGILGGSDDKGGPQSTQPNNAAPPPSQPSPYKNAGFDPSAIEKAVQNANDLSSKRINYAKIATELRSKSEELKDKLKKYQLASKQLETSRKQIEAQEKRRTLDMQIQENKKREHYRDQLKRNRRADEMKAEEFMKEEQMKSQAFMEQREEAIKRRTVEYEAELRQKTELTTVKAQTAGNIDHERKNQHLVLARRREQAREYRTTVMESVKLAGETIGKGLGVFLSDRQEMTAAIGTLSALALGIYSSKTVTGIAGRFVESRLGKPSLIRETSRLSVGQVARHPLVFARKMFGFFAPHNALEGVILRADLETRLSRIAQTTANTKQNRAPFRHVLLWGPPGTGKTMFAKGLAQHTGLEYAIMTGGDIAPLGRDAVTEIHKVFNWAQASRRGLLLFVDEADAFLQRRSNHVLSEDMRNALNAFLYRTGEATDTFMVVYASNQPEQFDDAINDRIDEMVHFGLPELAERKRMITHYMKMYLLDETPGRSSIKVVGVEEKDIDMAARLTEGFSGREIAKLAIAWQAAAYGNEQTEFTPRLMMSTLETHIEHKKKKNLWLDEVTKEVAYGPGGKTSGTPNLVL